MKSAPLMRSPSSARSQPPLYFYRDTNQKEIDLLIEYNQTLYPVEIKTTASPNKKMAKIFNLIDKAINQTHQQRGVGVIICQYPEKLFLAEDLVALPLAYV